MTLAVDVLFLVGFAAVVAGLYLVLGVGLTLTIGGALLIAAAVFVDRGRSVHGSGP